MKKNTFPALVLVLFTVLVFASCDMINSFIESRTRNIALIQLYNSNLEKTKKLLPNDTLYVEVQGLKAGKNYKVEVLDTAVPPNVVTMLTAVADETGSIPPTPLWYDAGFRKETVTVTYPGNISQSETRAVLVTKAEDGTTGLGLVAFNVRVSDDEENAADTGTDFKLPFFIVFTPETGRPRPIVMAGTSAKDSLNNDVFVLTNEFKKDEVLRVKVEPDTLTTLPVPTPASGKVRVLITPFKGSPYQNGDEISNVLLWQDVLISDITSETGVAIVGTDQGGHVWNTIPSWAEGKAFSVFVDVNSNGIYDVKEEGLDPPYYLDGIDGNGVAGFIVSQSAPPANLTHLNLASGGKFHYDYTNWQWDYDYRDEFKIDGSDTQYGYDYWYSGYGVKVIWNPYISYSGWTPPGQLASLYYGTYIDVYILDEGADLVDGAKLSDVKTTGTTKMTVPVQYGCYNGCGQQTIWRAPIASSYAGKGYRIFLDIDRDGFVTDGKDMIDDVKQDGVTKGTNNAGFSLVNP